MDIKIGEGRTDLKPSKLYTITLDRLKISGLLTKQPSVVKNWIFSIEFKNRCRLDRLIVGLDVKWHPTRNQNRAAIIQLCVADQCLILQTICSPTRISRHREFLQNPNYTFVGVGIESDAKMLLDDYGLKVSNTCDLREWAAKELDRAELCKAGLKDLAEVVLRKKFEKPNDITLNNWSKTKLTPPQVMYTCVDAYLSFEIGRRLSSWYY